MHNVISRKIFATERLETVSYTNVNSEQTSFTRRPEQNKRLFCINTSSKMQYERMSEQQKIASRPSLTVSEP
jgi:hypothetical protein